MKGELGVLKNVELRNIWQSEPSDFTPWLASNIEYLSKALGKDLEIIQTEYAVGDFSADIVATDLGSAKKVVIENQYGISDHRHLGQILLYCAGIKASCMVWIAESFKDEHRQVFEWLNANTINEMEFYAIEIEVIQIDESRPVPVFKIVESPNKMQTKRYEQIDSNISDTQEDYRRYFQSLIDELREKHKFTNAKIGQPQNWYSFTSELSGLFQYSTSFASKNRVRAEIYLDSGDQIQNKQLFDFLHGKKEEIERSFGEELAWERLDEKRASRVAIYIDGSIRTDTESLAKIKEWAIGKLLKFKKIFPEQIKKFDKNAKTSSAT